MTFQIGDEVALFVGGYLSRITTVTHTGIVRVAASDATFGADGWQRGKADRWTHQRIEPATDAHREALRRRAIITTLGGVNWQKLPTATLERVAAVVEEAL